MLITNFQQNQHKLNEQEHDILRYIRENMAVIQDYTLKRVASDLFVSPNTIVRLAQKLGFKGYSELKMAIIMDAETKPVKKQNSRLSLEEQLIQTKELLAHDKIRTIIERLKQSQHVYFFACGPSKYPCEEMKEKLRIFGIDTSLYYEPHIMKQRAKQLTKQDTLIVVSLSGETSTPLDAMKIAKLSDAQLISITGFSQNSIAKLADIALYTFYETSVIHDMDVSSRLGIHYILNLLFDELITTC